MKGTLFPIAVVLCVARLTAQQPAHYYNPAWSPDGQTLAFESTRDGKSAIYTIGIDGTRLTQLTNNTATSEQAAWSRDGRQIVFSSDRDGHGELYVMNADGSNQRRLTRTPGGGRYQSSFSPDARWIVFQGRPDNALASEHVYIMRSDGSGLRELSDSAANSIGPKWLPDGRITFTQSRYTVRRWSEMTPAEMARASKAEEIVTLRLDGSGGTRAAKGNIHECCQSWTRDWTTTFFISARDGTDAVYAMNADGGNLRRIVDAATVPDPLVSPDGRMFAYTRDAGDQYGVYVYDITTTRERVLIGGAGRGAAVYFTRSPLPSPFRRTHVSNTERTMTARHAVTGIGGVFFKARDPKALAEWYREQLGVPVATGATYGTFSVGANGRDDTGTPLETAWSTFPTTTEYFGPSGASFMLNYRVADLDAMRAQLAAAGASVDERVDESEFGRFGWAADPEGNRFELWQPPPAGIA